MSGKTLGIAAMSFFVGITVGALAYRAFYLDACLDNGGAWNAETSMCLEIRFLPSDSPENEFWDR